jgi:hypothetical protein
LLDVLQSVPILGFLSFTVTFFLGLFPGSILGAECAAVFAIFTSQAWNMAFSFYQSLRSVPRDLIEVARGFRLSWWQRFWQLETPFAVPGLIWNMMMSMSGGWFFVVASEAIAVGDTTIKARFGLPCRRHRGKAHRRGLRGHHHHACRHHRLRPSCSGRWLPSARDPGRASAGQTRKVLGGTSSRGLIGCAS